MNKAQLVPNFFRATVRTGARLASALESVLSNLGKQGSPAATAGDEDYALGNLLCRDFFRLIDAFGLLRPFGLLLAFGLLRARRRNESETAAEAGEG